MSADPIVYKEGMLLKRQRGLRANNTRKLKFQERFCCLTNTSLDYYDPLPKKRVSVQHCIRNVTAAAAS